MFTQEELVNLKTLLTRVDLKGNEAMPVAMLQQKVHNLIAQAQAQPAEVKEPETTA